jgi:allophanate hydrolase subunit 2
MGSARTQDDRVGCFVRTEESAPSEIAVVAFDQDRAEFLCSGPRIPASDPIPSMPVMPGAIQLLDDGTVIVLGPDGGLTGGYPVIGVIASAHLDFMADLIVAATVAFTSISARSAIEAFAVREEWLARSLVNPHDLP